VSPNSEKLTVKLPEDISLLLSPSLLFYELVITRTRQISLETR
jgi:hypothetical protein